MRRVTAGILCVVAGVLVGVLVPRAEHSQPVAKSSRIALSPEEAWPLPGVPPSGDAGVRVLTLLGAPASLARDEALAHALDAMTAEDFIQHARELTNLLKPKFWDSELEDAVVDRWFRQAPSSARGAAVAALAELNANPNPFLRSWWLGCIARHDPQSALAYLERNAVPTYGFSSSNSVIVREITQKDRKLAERTLRDFDDCPSRGQLLAGYVEGVAKSDPVGAMDAALTEKTYHRDLLLTFAIRAAAGAGTGTARLAISKIRDPSERKTAAWLAARVIAEESAASPFEFLKDEALLVGPLHETDAVWASAGEALDSLAERDPREAANWASELSTGTRDAVLGKVLAAWSELDPEAVSAWAGEKRGEVADHAEAHNVTPEEKEVTLTAVASLGKLVAAQRLLDQGAVAEALQVPPGDLRDVASEMIERFAIQAANQDPATAAEWAARLPMEVRDGVVSKVAEQFAKSDPEGVVKWVERLPNGSTRDGALSEMARVFAQSDPAAASAWVDQISTPSEVDKAVEGIWSDYLRINEAEAREWLNRLSRVSPRIRRKLLGL